MRSLLYCEKCDYQTTDETNIAYLHESDLLLCDLCRSNHVHDTVDEEIKEANHNNEQYRKGIK